MKFEYVYDYRSITAFSLSVAGMYQLEPKENVVLLSRNEPLKILFPVCKKEVTSSLCTVHMFETEEYLFCNTCAKKHEELCNELEHHGDIPVVNSPRMGVCDYHGGTIDLQRDGNYST